MSVSVLLDILTCSLGHVNCNLATAVLFFSLSAVKFEGTHHLSERNASNRILSLKVEFEPLNIVLHTESHRFPLSHSDSMANIRIRLPQRRIGISESERRGRRQKPVTIRVSLRNKVQSQFSASILLGAPYAEYRCASSNFTAGRRSPLPPTPRSELDHDQSTSTKKVGHPSPLSCLSQCTNHEVPTFGIANEGPPCHDHGVSIRSVVLRETQCSAYRTLPGCSSFLLHGWQVGNLLPYAFTCSFQSAVVRSVRYCCTLPYALYRRVLHRSALHCLYRLLHSTTAPCGALLCSEVLLVPLGATALQCCSGLCIFEPHAGRLHSWQHYLRPITAT